MTALKNLSVIWAIVHTVGMFLMLFECRYPRKKAIILTAATMAPLMIANFIFLILVGLDRYGIIMFPALSLPCCILLWLLSKHRDGRFFFTFCMISAVALEIIYISAILNHYLTPDTYIVAFAIRLISYPLLELLICKKLRSIFLEVQTHIKKGWWIFTAIGAAFYAVITLIMSYPTPITQRPHDLPVLTILLLLMPVIYLNIFFTLRRQEKLHIVRRHESILQLQVSNLTQRLEEISSADEKFRMERHNFRHKMKVIANLVQTKQFSELGTLVEEYNETYQGTAVKRYCKNAVIDAVLSAYISKAEKSKTKVELGLAFPETLPVNEAELATALANALENAVNATQTLDEKDRRISVRVLNHPRFIIQIANTFNGKVEFDENEIPVSRSEGHGFGTRSIVTFCEKYNGYYQFKASDNIFTLYLNF